MDTVLILVLIVILAFIVVTEIARIDGLHDDLMDLHNQLRNLRNDVYRKE